MLAASLRDGQRNGGHSTASSAWPTGMITQMNRLAEETSPYLLQHAHNPVNWYPWGEEAFARSREED
jgi:hypothetical protein